MVAQAADAVATGIIRYTWVIALLPFASAALILFFGKRTPGKGSGFGIAALGAAFAMSLAVLWHFVQGGGVQAGSIGWFSVGSFELELGQYVDGLTAVMLVVVTAVSLCVHVYSLGYMHGDVRFTWFYVVLSLFTGSMLNVVIADNLIQLLVGWEIMGVCSYLLIGHWYEEKENSNAAIKAFLTTRVGDVPFLFGIFALIFATGFTTSNIREISELVGGPEVSASLVTAAALLLFAGTIGKSAQFPLHVWLPDAMAGPTPVSALIHAATMVAAGVYLVGRMFEVFLAADPMALQVVGIVGGITMLGAALLALVQFDIKKVLAYSTVSQLAYMVTTMSVGEAGRNAAFFHLFTHAFFKALLFLAAGSVIHAVRSNDMRDMGGLRGPMPITFWTFVIGAAALAGIPPLSGFWSKDELLVAASEGHEVVFALLLTTAVVTALYTTRMVLMTFSGTYRGQAHPHESPASMSGPLIALAGANLVIGFLGAAATGAVFFDWVFLERPEEIHLVPWVAALSIAAAAVGILGGYAIYRRHRDPDPMLELGGISTVLVNKYYLDDVYLKGVVYPIRDVASNAVYRFNQRVLDGAVNGAAWAARASSALVHRFDRTVVDGAVNGAGQATRGFSAVLRFIQTGNVQWYAVALFVGVIALTIVFVRIA